MADHDCLDHLDYREKHCSQNVDPDVDPPAIERWTDVWWECEICHDKYTESEVTRLQNERALKEATNG